MNQFFNTIDDSSKGVKKALLMLLIGAFITVNVNAQFWDSVTNPKIPVKINHPPGLGLITNKIIFNPAIGDCSDQIIDALISDFVSNGVEVIDRNNLQMILAEHDFNFSGYVDRNSAVKIGQLIGPSAMITIKISRCHTEVKNAYKDVEKYDYETKRKYVERLYSAVTTAYLKGSIQTTDLLTGRIFTSRVFEYSPAKENQSYGKRPEAPSEYDVKELAFEYLTTDVHKMFFPWSETVNLFFMDDKNGGLKETFKVLKAGDIDQAFRLSKENLELCKNSTDKKEMKVLAHAYYNAGMMHFIKNDYDNAINYFQESQKIKAGSIVKESIAECYRAKELAEEMQKVDEKAEFQIEQINLQAQQEEKSLMESMMTNDDIIILTEKKLPTNLITQKIKTSKCKFDTSTEQLLKLANSGVAEEIILLMMEQN